MKELKKKTIWVFLGLKALEILAVVTLMFGWWGIGILTKRYGMCADDGIAICGLMGILILAFAVMVIYAIIKANWGWAKKIVNHRKKK